MARIPAGLGFLLSSERKGSVRLDASNVPQPCLARCQGVTWV